MEHATPVAIILLVALLAPVVIYIRRSKAGKEIFVRRIAGIDATEEAIGRAVEQGRPISFAFGMTEIGPLFYACLGVLYYVAKRAAKLKNKLLIPQRSPEAVAIVEDTIKEAYREVDRSENFDPTSVRFLSEEQFAYASGYMGIMHRENVGAAFLFGHFAGESLIMAEAGRQVGAMQVGASVDPEQTCFFITTCDYTLIGEEIFAASAYLSREPVQVGSLAGQDRAKLIFLVLIVIGILIATANSLLSLDLPNIDALINFNPGWFNHE
ncbi:MAG TPA: hypothetical protein PKD37_04570 [Oligoflexia bacterium]|nr:hypothetical protein [Oligoflexia bacterium]HMP27238.1 hypothetical protein [Oligoflexia bacterium]